MNDMTFRPYTPADKDVCIEVFLSNTPKYFGSEELAEFERFLDTLPCPYYVVTQGNTVLACGGYGFNDKKNNMVLAWGMARADLHKQGLGSFLLAERLKQIYRNAGRTMVEIDTSQHSQGFFERFGFIPGGITENYYAPGIHRVDMQLDLTEQVYNTLTNRIYK